MKSSEKPVTIKLNNGLTVDVLKGSIRVYGLYRHSAMGPVDRTFKVGDVAEHGSYNLSYTGPIKSISTKCVTIDASDISRGTRRLKLEEFAWRNYNFDAEKTFAHNAEVMNHI